LFLDPVVYARRHDVAGSRAANADRPGSDNATEKVVRHRQCSSVHSQLIGTDAAGRRGSSRQEIRTGRGNGEGKARVQSDTAVIRSEERGVGKEGGTQSQEWNWQREMSGGDAMQMN